MSKRRELQEHSDSLADIGELLGAMKNLALVESRRIATFIDAQRAAAGIVERTLSDFVSDYAGHIVPTEHRGEVLCVIGSERGFCGDLNQRLACAAEEIHSGGRPVEVGEADTDRRIVLVGSRLADAWRGEAAAKIPGAGFADEVQNILADLVATLTPLLRTTPHAGPPALSLLYFNDSGPVHQAMLPAPMPPHAGARRSHPIQINLAPQLLHVALIDQFLQTALGCALYDALLHENQLRLEHMEQARHRIDEQLEDLSRRANRARQEEITEEIEVILLSSIAAENG